MTTTTKQKFAKGDLVHIAADLGSSMSHFTADVDAIVLGTYAELYGGKNVDSYSLHLKGHGPVSWYHENQLTLIEPNRPDLLEVWKAEAKRLKEQQSDLVWIFTHPEAVHATASIIALAGTLGFTENDMWGSRGEGYVFHRNATIVQDLARPFIEKGDREGWEKFAAAQIERMKESK